jgi:hypothetical protein
MMKKLNSHYFVLILKTRKTRLWLFTWHKLGRNKRTYIKSQSIKELRCQILIITGAMCSNKIRCSLFFFLFAKFWSSMKEDNFIGHVENGVKPRNNSVTLHYGMKIRRPITCFHQKRVDTCHSILPSVI